VVLLTPQAVCLATLHGWVFPDVMKDDIVAIFRVKQSKIFFLSCLNLKVEAVRYFKTSKSTYPVTQRNIPDNLNLRDRLLVSSCFVPVLSEVHMTTTSEEFHLLLSAH